MEVSLGNKAWWLGSNDSPLLIWQLPRVVAGSNNNIWESSVVNGDDLALSFGLADTKAATRSQPQQLASMAFTNTNLHEDCSSGECRYV